MKSRVMQRHMIGGVLAAIFALISGGCGPDFEPYWRVDDLRVLAVQAEPVVLQGGEVAALSALAHQAEGAPISYAWEWCPFRVSAENNYECPMSADALNEMLQQQGESGLALPDDFFDIGEGEEVSFAYPGTPELIRGFCDAIVSAIADAGERSPLGTQLPVMDCERGFEVSVRLLAEADGQEIVARKRLLLSTGPKTQMNRNPEMSGLEISLADEADRARVAAHMPWVSQTSTQNSDTRWFPIPADQPLPIVAGVAFKLRALVDPQSVETWTPPAPEGSDEEFLEPREEALMFRWFTSAGILEKSSSLYVDGQNSLFEASETEFEVKFDADTRQGEGVTSSLSACEPAAEQPDAEADACDVYLWSIVRDGRLGQAFIERRVRLVSW